MRPTIKHAVLAAVFVAAAGGVGSRAFAQDRLVATVPFEFMLSGNMHEPGRYEFQVTDDGQIVELRGPARSGSIAEVITRVASPAMANDVEGRLIFDKIGDTNYLAELWLPDQDGFVLHATNEPRTHTSVKLDRGGKAHS